MSFGGGGFGGFGQQGQQQQQQQSTAFGGFGSTQQATGSGFGSTGTGAFGSTQPTAGTGLFGGGAGSGFGTTTGAFGSTPTSSFGAAKPAFGGPTSTGLFGSSSTTTAPATGFGGGGFGSTAATTSSAPFGGSSSLFGGAKPAGGGFGSGGANAGTSLFGGGTSGGAFGGGGTTGAFGGATSNPGIGTGIGDPPGTGAVMQFNPFIEKEANTATNQQNSFQNVLFLDNFKKWSSEELRLADYNQGRKHGSAGGTSSFGMGSGFGSGFGSTTQPTSGFGGGTTSTGTSLFGNNQPASTGFGQTAGGTGAFGSTGLFSSAPKPATTGLFGGTPQQPAQTGQTTGLFGTSSGGFGGTGTTGTGFGSAATGGTGLFGSSSTAAKPPGGFSFGGTGTQATGGFGNSGTTNAFGGGSTGTGTGLFGGGGGGGQQTGVGLFGGGAAQTANTGFGGGGFGAQPQQSTGSVFGQQQSQAKPGLFGQQTSGTTGTGLFGGAGGTTSTPFSSSTSTGQQATGGGLFGQKAPGTTGGLFGGSAPTQTGGGTGTGLFGGLGQSTQAQQQPQQSSLFGGLGQTTQPKPLFGGQQQSTGGGIFGGQPAQQGGLFGGTAQQQQQPSGLGGSMFGATQGTQSTPQSLTTSINDVSAYGTPSLFQGLGTGEVQNPGPLATPLSGGKTKAPRRSSILPMYRLNPSSATRGGFTTPQKRGYGMSYSAFGTPTSPSSVASTPGALGQSLFGGSISRGLSKSISSSNLRRTFNAEDSILTPGAFSASSSGGRYYGSTGSVKKLVINRDIRSDLFSTPNKEKQPTTDSRKLTKRVSFDTSNAQAIENGTEGSSRVTPDTSNNGTRDLGYVRPSSHGTNGVNGAKPTSSGDEPPEMEQVKGNELTVVHEEEPPAQRVNPAPSNPDDGDNDYWLSPTKEEISTMNRVQRQQVANFTVGRPKIGQVRFKVPVDLSTINIDDIPGGIVELLNRRATVYPDPAKKPSPGKGLNVPAEITLEGCFPRAARTRNKDALMLKTHIERLKQIENTTFISFDADSGVWVFAVEHFTTYGLDYDEDETDAEVVDDVQGLEEEPSVPAHQPSTAFESPDLDPDDTFEFRRKRRALPGAFDAEISDEEEENIQEPSFLSSRSAEVASHALVPVTVEDEYMTHEDDLSENEEVATSSQRHHPPAEHPDDSPYMESLPQVQETPAGIMRARMRALKESATPLKLQVTGGDDWMAMLQQTMSPQKRDRAALRASDQAGASQSMKQSYREKAPDARSRIASDNRGFATSIDLMNSLFEKAKTPSQAPQTITPAKGFVKWPYRRQNKSADEDEANMAPLERLFHNTFKPRWGPDGVCIFPTSTHRNDFYGDSISTRDMTLHRVNVFTTREFAAEDPLDGIVDHRDLVDIETINGIPTISTQRVSRIKVFSSFRNGVFGEKPSPLSSLSKRLGSYEQSVWGLASVLFDPIDAQLNKEDETRVRRKNLAKFWANLVDETSLRANEQRQSFEEKAITSLSHHRVTEACKALLDGKNFKLATLVSLIGTSDSFKRDMREQMDDWLQGDVLSEFTLAHRVLYALLGGNVTICPGKKNGVGIENRMETELISHRFGFNWKQAFGLRLWYGIAAGDGIEAAVEQFMEDVEQGKVPAPRPWYVEQGVQVLWEDPNRDDREDLLWGLLKVFARQARLEDVLQPENSQLAPFNFRLCWQLGQALSATNGTTLSSTGADALTTSYATEVVYHGKSGNWIAAIWVLLHLTDPASRVKAVQEILTHHAGGLFTKEATEYNFFARLVGDLKIPSTWVWQAAALHWRSKQNHSSLEAHCLLKASAFAEAHQIFIKALAPKAVIEGNYEEISSMLQQFQPHQHAIPNWALGGEVYRNFLELITKKKLGQPVPSQVIDSLISSLPTMYDNAQNSDTVEVAAIAEMADAVAKEAVALANQGRIDLSKVLRLPLTEDRQLRYSSDMAIAHYKEAMSARG